MDSLAGQVDKQVKLRERAREQEGIRPVMAEMSMQIEEPPGHGALSALLRNSFAAASDNPASPQVTVKIAPIGMSLERDGCDYVHVALRLLEYYKCPPQCRLFVLALCALSNGDADSFHIITDDMIGEVVGYKRHSVKPMRETLVEWMQEKNYAFIDIIEGDRDRSTMKYVPTQYRVRIVTIIGRYVRDARAMNMRSPRAAIKTVTSRENEELMERAVKDTPTAPLVRRRERPRGFAPSQQTYAERQIDMTYSRMDKCVESVNDLMGTFMMNGNNPWTIRDELVNRIDDNIRKITVNYPEYQRE